MITLPLLFEKYTRKLFGEAYEGLQKAITQEVSPVSIRINKAKNRLIPVHASPVDWNSDGYYLPQRPNFTFDPLFHAGGYYVQEASSMFLRQIIEQFIPEPVRFLDLCASPGGKSTDAISALPPGSLVVSNEVMRNRAHILAENIIKWGSPNCIVTRNEAADFGQLTHYFDVILTDVPCSGEGMFRKDEQAITEWSPDNVFRCASRQEQILHDVWKALRPGGLLIYSTCTYNTEENEDKIEYLKKEFGAEPLSLTKPADWGITDAVKGNDPVNRFLPHRTKGEGLFMAVVRKPENEEVFAREKLFDNRTKQKKSKKEKTTIGNVPPEVKNWIRENSDFEFITHDEDVIAIPKSYVPDFEMFLTKFTTFHAGITVATNKIKEWQPHHSLGMSVLLNKDLFDTLALTYTQAIAYLRREALPLATPSSKGYALVTYEGLPLGWVKQVGNRANNLYPQEWRIRSGYMPENFVPLFSSENNRL